MSTSTDDDRFLYLEERQQAILDLLDTQDVVRISDLSERFHVSPATIRKDMRALELEGKLRRTHGGAIKPNLNATEQRLEVASVSAHGEKERIGRVAAQLVRDGDIFIVQSGTTCHEFVRALKGRHGLTLVTCDLSIAMEAEGVLPDSTIVMLGGVLRNGYHYSQGMEALTQLRGYHTPTAYLGSNAFSFENGFSAHRVEQANWVKELIRASDKHVMLMDSTKIGVDALAHVADLTEIDYLVTDRGVDDESRRMFAKQAPDVEVLYA